MYKKSKIKEYEDRGVKKYDPNKKNCIVTDLDGTLALINGRGYYDDFKYDTDIVNKELNNIIHVLRCEIGHSIENGKDSELIIITGRSEAGVGRKNTEKWLNENNIVYDKLLMRKSGDFRKDYITKSEIIQELQKEYNILCAFDDRNSSAQAFRDNGILCMQVWEDDTEQKPCEHCSDKQKNIIKDDQCNYVHIFNNLLIVDMEDKNTDQVYKEIKINYCPMCGRKLK